MLLLACSPPDAALVPHSQADSGGARIHSLTIADCGRQVEVKKGEQLRVYLPIQAGTGYRWLVSEGSRPHINVEKDDLGPGTIPGGQSMQMLLLRPTEQEDFTLKLLYGRSWEVNQRPSREFSVRVNVKNPAKSK